MTLTIYYFLLATFLSFWFDMDLCVLKTEFNKILYRKTIFNTVQKWSLHLQSKVVLNNTYGEFQNCYDLL